MAKNNNSEIPDTTAVIELKTVTDIADRYQCPGPHATVIMRVVLPGVRGDDRQTRRHALQDDLRHHGADDAMIGHIDDALESLDPRGLHVLLTANAESGAFCWLTDYEAPSGIRVNAMPVLLPVLTELSDRAPVICALVDNIGADLVELGHVDLVGIDTVAGEEDSTERYGGRNRDGYDRWANEVHNRNADLIAKHLSDHADRAKARIVLLSGNDGEISSVEHHLGHHRFAVSTVQAGARHDKEAPDRLREAAGEAAQSERTKRRDERVGRLRQELGQHDLAVAGHDKTLEAINEGSVETLFLDAGKLEEMGDSDAIAKDALLFGGDVVIAPDLPTDDGVAALLRYKST
jgi:hypothetical protein